MKRWLLVLVVLLVTVFRVSSPSQSVVAVHTQIDQITAQASTVAVQSGNWSDPATWGGTLPPIWATIAIPPDLTVTVDGVLSTPYLWIRTEGTLTFARDVDTRLITETLAVMDGGKLDVGPIPAGVHAQLIFQTRLAAFDLGLDPLQITRGLIAMSPVSLRGAAVNERISLNGFPAAGASEFDLDEDPIGWEAGGEVLVAPTINGQDEVVRVQTIVGRHVTFTPPLQYTRTNHPDDPMIKIHVGYLTRNVEIRTDPAQAGVKPPECGGSPCLQGHVMLMGGGHEIHYVAFRDTGRTLNKAVTDPIVLANGSRDPSLMPICNVINENVRGRYALHFHNPGPDSPLSTAEGVVIRVQRNAGLKVGIQNHSANLRLTNPIVHQIDGSGIFAEEGDERGELTGAFVVYGLYNGSTKAPLPNDEVCQKRDYLDIWNRRRADFGSRTAGVWLQGSGNWLLRDNVFAGLAHAGIDHKAEGLDKRKANTFAVLSRPNHLRDGFAWVASKVNDFDPERAMLDQKLPPLTILDTQVYAIGDKTRYSDKAAFTSSGMGLQMAEWPDRPKNLIARFLAWNVGICVKADYSDWGRLEDVTCIGGFQTPGSRPDIYDSAHIGVTTSTQNGRYWQFVRLRIEDFGKGYEFFPAPGSTFDAVTINGQPYQPIEKCGNLLDDDGDGLVDENCGA